MLNAACRGNADASCKGSTIRLGSTSDVSHEPGDAKPGLEACLFARLQFLTEPYVVDV